MVNDRQSGLLRLISAQSNADAAQSCYSLSETGETAIGRTADCQVIIDSNLYGGVSRRHAVVQPTGSRTPQGAPIWQICDLNSANGTYVNGQKIQGCQTLNVGDRVMFSHNGPEFLFEHRATQLVDQFVATGSTPPAPPSYPSPTPPSSPPQPPVYPPQPGAVSNQASVSQLFPVVSARQDLFRKGYLVPGILTVLIVVSLFISQGDLRIYIFLLAFYLGGGGLYFIYRFCGKKKPWWVLLLAVFWTVIMLIPIPANAFPFISNPEGVRFFNNPILQIFILIFRDILPGKVMPFQRVDSSEINYLQQLIGHFFGAGLMEELLKAIPIFGLYVFGKQLRPPNRQRVGVLEPLDGILVGAASALGFTIYETLFQYVPLAIESGGALAGVQLLIPRVLGSVAGHMAYSGIFGYFIGLSILKPSQCWKTLTIGYLIASSLHAFWNASSGLASISVVLVVTSLLVVGVLSYAFLAAVILKARQLSPTRSQNFATRIAPPN
ncbi:PrsW family glutamic-type intramembrane protease [Acaryochloris marina NIES-2412]|uniref:PrsW family glutamic-type intramembrane protease n=1 Tax=Acaryochloris marina TaxID=155978 RepID=UPI004057D0F1